MLILIAESKTMTACDSHVRPETFESHRPGFDRLAGEIMESLADAAPDQLAEEVGISMPYARKLCRMIYEFPNKSLGAEAMVAYTGVVFNALDYKSFDEAEKMRLSHNVRIISSLYGLLRPDDIVKPYRFDFTTRVAPGGASLASYWRPRVTESLSALLQSLNEKNILDLLPGDAARYIDWGIIGGFAKVWKADFRQIGEEGAARTPHTGRLKTL